MPQRLMALATLPEDPRSITIWQLPTFSIHMAAQDCWQLQWGSDTFIHTHMKAKHQST